jgi:hypothetical protein
LVPGAVVRLAHVLIAAAVLLLLPSGLQIFNAHPTLYTGETSARERAWDPTGSLRSLAQVTGRSGQVQSLLP